jgi:NDP-sugar pyrophosphorylase family protein
VVRNSRDRAGCRSRRRSPHESISNLVNTGIYVLEPEVLEEYILESTFFDFAEEVFPSLLAAGETLVGHEGDFYWSDIGTLDAYRMAQRDALLGRVAGRGARRAVGQGSLGRGKVLDPPVRLRAHRRLRRRR